MSQDICVQRWAYAFYSLNNLYDFFMKKKMQICVDYTKHIAEFKTK